MQAAKTWSFELAETITEAFATTETSILIPIKILFIRMRRRGSHIVQQVKDLKIAYGASAAMYLNISLLL